MSQQPVHHGDPSDGPFLLPSSGFFADEALGAGHVQLPDDFFELERERVAFANLVDGQQAAIDGGDESAVEYDSLARPIRWWTRGTQTGEAPAPRLMQEIAFDALGEHVAQRSILLDEKAPAVSRHHDEYTWDPAGRLLTHRAPWGATTRYDYDGKLAHVTDPFEQVTTLENDALGRLVKVSPPIDEATSYGYGPFGALAAITAPGNAVTTLLRDAFGRVRTSIDPDKGTTLLDYNGFGELRSSLDAQGRSTTLHRDLLGRVIARDDQASGGPLEVTTWIWDSAPLGTSGALALGALASVVAPDGTAIVHSYDALARPSRSTVSSAGSPSIPRSTTTISVASRPSLTPRSPGSRPSPCATSTTHTGTCSRCATQPWRTRARRPTGA